jgi:hypothetical protein
MTVQLNKTIFMDYQSSVYFGEYVMGYQTTSSTWKLMCYKSIACILNTLDVE